MIKKYLNFINEEMDLIIESNVVYSDKFRKVLSKIKNPLSPMLLDIENKDFPVKSNYFDIKLDSNDKVSFTPDRKAVEILGDSKEMVTFMGGSSGWLTNNLHANGNIFTALGYTSEETAYKPNNTEIGEVIKKMISTSGRTYVYVKFPGGKGVYNIDKLHHIDNRQELIWNRNRQDINVGRAIRALLKIAKKKLLDRDVEQFVNLYKSSIDKLNDRFSYFEEVQGDDVHKWYQSRNYYNDDSGTLANSCMKRAPVSWLEIYSKNPEQVSLVILRSTNDQDRIVGRALLWTIRDGKKFMDRVYTTKDSDVQLFRDYAKQKGWYAKSCNNSSAISECISPEDGTMVNLDIVVDLSTKEYEAYPYMDTLKYLNYGKGMLSTHDSGSGNDYKMENIDGEYQSVCETCHGSGTVDCDSCDGGTVECNSCDGNGKVNCDACGGIGEAECNDCNGSGKVVCDECIGGKDDNGNECSYCHGTGQHKCNYCDGIGKKPCRECEGTGKTECVECDGRGKVDCDECNGNGVVDCPECN